MNSTVECKGLTIHIRTERIGDQAVIDEVIASDTYRLREIYESGFSPKTILDLGAHIGCFAMQCAQYWPDATIVCVEPNARSVELLKLNVPNGKHYNAGLSHSKARQVYVDGEGATGGGFVDTAANYKNRKDLNTEIYSIADDNISTLTLGELMQLAEVESFDLIKADAEGGELDMIKHIDPKVAAATKLLLGEYHHEGGYQAFEAIAKAALPHLEFWGGHPGEEPGARMHIGPFWAQSQSYLKH
jgi:FkbM family methyltransferase